MGMQIRGTSKWNRASARRFVQVAGVVLLVVAMSLQTLPLFAQFGRDRTTLYISMLDKATLCLTDRSEPNYFYVDYNGIGTAHQYWYRQCFRINLPDSILQILGVGALLERSEMDTDVTADLTMELRVIPSQQDTRSLYQRQRLGFLRFVDMRYGGYVYTDYPEALFNLNGILSVRFPERHVRWWEGKRPGERQPTVIRRTLPLHVSTTIPANTLFEFSAPHDADGFYGIEQPYQRAIAIYEYQLGIMQRFPKHTLELAGNLSFRMYGYIHGRGIPYSLLPFRVTQAARHGLITMQYWDAVDPESINPVGVVEIGENEYVYQDNPPLLRIPILARVYASDIYSQQLFNTNTPIFRKFNDPPNYPEMRWWASRLHFTVLDEHSNQSLPGAAPLTEKRIENGYAIVPWSRVGANSVRGLVFTGNTLPPLEYFGRYRAWLTYQHRNADNRAENVPVHSAPIEVFFPANGWNHPQDGPPGVAGYWTWDSTGDRGSFAEYAPHPTPNWFYYYWAAFVRDNPNTPDFANIRYVHFLSGSGSNLPLGFYGAGQNYVNITSELANYLNARGQGLPLHLFRSDDNGRIQRVDFLHTYAYHAFQMVVAHEFAHMYLYVGGIVGEPDTDGDGLQDGWEIALGLDPTERYSLRFVYNTDYPRSDQEFLCDVIAYGFLLSKEGTWRSDWADTGLQKGVPISPFPWRYDSSGTNRSRYTDLIDSLDDLLRR